ncbi:uncharacterized protein LOC129117519 isoform X2 [Agelaius phoeniceus]|uniref:uncharacterized protein LOC129117519 isoform X2 n=1 Tax=Agelaius phoeniceus TaxID=39638 RepID=UPI004054DD72
MDREAEDGSHKSPLLKPHLGRKYASLWLTAKHLVFYKTTAGAGKKKKQCAALKNACGLVENRKVLTYQLQEKRSNLYRRTAERTTCLFSKSKKDEYRDNRDNSGLWTEGTKYSFTCKRTQRARLPVKSHIFQGFCGCLLTGVPEVALVTMEKPLSVCPGMIH